MPDGPWGAPPPPPPPSDHPASPNFEEAGWNDAPPPTEARPPVRLKRRIPPPPPVAAPDAADPEAAAPEAAAPEAANAEPAAAEGADAKQAAPDDRGREPLPLNDPQGSDQAPAREPLLPLDDVAPARGEPPLDAAPPNPTARESEPYRIAAGAAGDVPAPVDKSLNVHAERLARMQERVRQKKEAEAREREEEEEQRRRAREEAEAARNELLEQADRLQESDPERAAELRREAQGTALPPKPEYRPTSFYQPTASSSAEPVEQGPDPGPLGIGALDKRGRRFLLILGLSFIPVILLEIVTWSSLSGLGGWGDGDVDDWGVVELSEEDRGVLVLADAINHRFPDHEIHRDAEFFSKYEEGGTTYLEYSYSAYENELMYQGFFDDESALDFLLYSISSEVVVHENESEASAWVRTRKAQQEQGCQTCERFDEEFSYGSDSQLLKTSADDWTGLPACFFVSQQGKKTMSVAIQGVELTEREIDDAFRPSCNRLVKY